MGLRALIVGHIHAIRWTPDCYRLEPFPLDAVNLTDPRQFSMAKRAFYGVGRDDES